MMDGPLSQVGDALLMAFGMSGMSAGCHSKPPCYPRRRFQNTGKPFIMPVRSLR
jgi:hypothetical protein